MDISVDIKRVVLTTLVCFVTAIFPLFISTSEVFYTFSAPLLFSLAIPLTSFDRIITKRKYQALVLSTLLTVILFFISIPLGLFLGNSFLGQYSDYIVCLISGLMVLLINSIFIQIDNIKLGLLLTGLLALAIPSLTIFMKGHKIFDIEFFGDPATFFIIWQTVIGLAISISIWTKTNISKAINE
jgi:hypothetical protein